MTTAFQVSPADELALEDSDIQLVLDESERALIETIGLFGDEGWEAVASNFPLTWRTLETVKSARATFRSLIDKRLAVTVDGRVELTEDGRWIAGMLR